MSLKENHVGPTVSYNTDRPIDILLHMQCLKQKLGNKILCFKLFFVIRRPTVGHVLSVE